MSHCTRIRWVPRPRARRRLPQVTRRAGPPTGPKHQRCHPSPGWAWGKLPRHVPALTGRPLPGGTTPPRTTTLVTDQPLGRAPPWQSEAGTWEKAGSTRSNWARVMVMVGCPERDTAKQNKAQPCRSHQTPSGFLLCTVIVTPQGVGYRGSLSTGVFGAQAKFSEQVSLLTSSASLSPSVMSR